MPRCTDLDRAVAHLDGAGACDVEVMLCVDTRSPSDISWFPALAAFRVAWAEGHRARLFVDLVGNVPACFQRRSFWWHKVFVGNRLLRCRRLKLLLWMDTDSTIVPEKDANQHRERSVALTFPSLQELWDRALALRRGVPADGGEPASGGEPKGKPARGGGPCLIGYHDRSGFNAGVWLVAGGDGVLYARMQVLFVGFRGPCPAGPCPAGPGPGPPGPGPPSPGSPGFGPAGPGPGPPGRGPGRPRPRPARVSSLGRPPLDERHYRLVYWGPSDRGGRPARSLFAAWLAHYPGDGWAPKGAHQQAGFEQFEFNKHLVARPGVALVPEEEFCSRRAAGTTPLVHFYGHCQFAGKASIASFAVQTCAALSREQRKLVPDFTAWVRQVSTRTQSAAAKDFRGARANSSDGARRALGKPVVYEGVEYPSVRAAATATGVHRATITANAERRKRRRPASSGATRAAKRRRPAASGVEPAASGVEPAPRRRHAA